MQNLSNYYSYFTRDEVRLNKGEFTMIDHFVSQAMRIMWYSFIFLIWVGKAFVYTLINMSGRRRR